MTESLWLPAVVLAPLALGVTCFLLPERAARVLALPGWMATAALTAGLVAQLAEGPRRYALGGWGAPLGVELAADGLSAALLVLGAAVYAGVLPYAAAYFAPRSREATHFWPLAWLLWGALNAVFVSADLFNLYVSIELLSLSAIGLAALSGAPAALGASLRYLLAALIGSNLLLLSVALLYGATGELAFARVAAALAPGPAAATAAAVLIVALALKSALAPLHFWLPPAHAGAATPVSALLSALVIKGTLYGLLRLWLLLSPSVGLPAAGTLLAVLGTAAILWGSMAALLQSRLKRVVAYSTVAQVGYLFVAFAMLAPGQPAAATALEGGVLHLLAHGLAKAAAFLAAGALVLGAGRDDVLSLRGAAARQPLAVFAFGLAGASLIGLPPSAGFAAKWQLLRAAIESDQWGWAAVVLGGSLLAAAYVFRILRLAFQPDPGSQAAPRASAWLTGPALALSLAAAAGGLWSAALLERLGARALLAAWGP